MVTRLTTSEEIIAKIIADFDLADYDVRISDMITWIGEAVEKIGGMHRYATEVTMGEEILKVCGHQAKLPCNIKNLLSVAYSKHPDGGWIPTRSSTSPFNKWASRGKGHGEWQPHYTDEQLISIAMAMYPDRVNPCRVLEDLQCNPNFRQELIDLMKQNDTDYLLHRAHRTTDYTRDITYSIKPGFINLNVPEGYLKVSYTVMPVDDNGYPLVPDLASVQEAVYWYVAMKLLYPKYVRQEVPQYIYYDAKAQWSSWSTAAYGQLMMPNYDEMTSAKHVWNTIYPQMREEQTFYSTTGNYHGVHQRDVTNYYNYPHRYLVP